MLAVLAFIAAASMGADSDARDVAMSVMVENGASVTIDAMPFTRTVTCTGEYTVIGSTNGGTGGVTWSASPSGESGACFDLVPPAFYCDVIVAPDFAGEGVETITIARSGATSATTTIGFYVDGAHSCFLSQSVNGSYNSGLTNADAVATWENLGTSALDVTQGTGGAQPSYRTAVVGGQPVVRCDGGDRLAASTASDWTFLYDGTDWTVEHIAKTTTGPFGVYVTTENANSFHGFVTIDNTAAMFLQVFNATPTANFSFSKSPHAVGSFHLASFVLDDDGGAGNDASIFLDSLAAATAARASTYSVTTAQPLNVCAYANASFPLTGDMFAVRIYQSALTSTQRGINKAVDEWALGGTLPVTP